MSSRMASQLLQRGLIALKQCLRNAKFPSSSMDRALHGIIQRRKYGVDVHFLHPSWMLSMELGTEDGVRNTIALPHGSKQLQDGV